MELEGISRIDMELADDPGSIACPLQDVGESRVMQMRVQSRASGGEPILAVSMRIDSSQHGAARRAAGGLGNVGDFEQYAARSESVEVRRFDDLVPIATELEPKVV